MLVYNHTFLLVFTCLFSNGPGEEKPGMSHDFPTNFPRVLAWLFYLGLVNPWEMEERNAHLQIYMGKSSRNDMDFPAKKIKHKQQRLTPEGIYKLAIVQSRTSHIFSVHRNDHSVP